MSLLEIIRFYPKSKLRLDSYGKYFQTDNRQRYVVMGTIK